MYKLCFISSECEPQNLVLNNSFNQLLPAKYAVSIVAYGPQATAVSQCEVNVPTVYYIIYIILCFYALHWALAKSISTLSVTLYNTIDTFISILLLSWVSVLLNASHFAVLKAEYVWSQDVGTTCSWAPIICSLTFTAAFTSLVANRSSTFTRRMNCCLLGYLMNNLWILKRSLWLNCAPCMLTVVVLTERVGNTSHSMCWFKKPIEYRSVSLLQFWIQKVRTQHGSILQTFSCS